MAEQPPSEKKTVRVPITALIAVQRMLNREGLAELARDLSAENQIDIGPTLSTAGRLGIDLPGLRSGRTTFIEGLEAARRLSEVPEVPALSQDERASAKVSLALIKDLRDRIRSMPALLAKDPVARALANCPTPDPFNCPREWPEIAG